MTHRDAIRKHVDTLARLAAIHQKDPRDKRTTPQITTALSDSDNELPEELDKYESIPIADIERHTEEIQWYEEVTLRGFEEEHGFPSPKKGKSITLCAIYNNIYSTDVYHYCTSEN